MSCDSTKFVISKGVDNTFTFTIKQDNSTLPLTIVGGDTFFADLILLEGDAAYAQVTNKALTVEDMANGKVSLVIAANETTSLVTDKSSKVDRYYSRPTYRLLLRCNTTNNGDFIATVDYVYVS